jgi:hypothetical protein
VSRPSDAVRVQIGGDSHCSAVEGESSEMRRILKAVAIVATIELLIMNVLAMAQAAPKILLIAREPLNPGAEAEYDRIESQTAVLAQEIGCPHPYLALQPLSGTQNEVWWFNVFDSEDELNSVGEAYKTKEAWNAALTRNQKRKERLTGKVIERLADLELHTDSQPWAMGRARYVVVAINPATRLNGSNVFKGRDGTHYEILTANAREEAEQVERGKDFVLLEVVTRWSFPAREWVEGNREMWKGRAISKRGDVR